MDIDTAGLFTPSMGTSDGELMATTDFRIKTSKDKLLWLRPNITEDEALKALEAYRKDWDEGATLERRTISAWINEEMRAKIQADITAGKVQVQGEWLVLQVGECTCAGGDEAAGYHHESFCGYEPIVRLIDVL